MNLASWIILIVVVGVLALAIKATFFKKKSRGGCCDTGDHDDVKAYRDNTPSACSGCSGCADFSSCAAAQNTLQATFRSLE